MDTERHQQTITPGVGEATSRLLWVVPTASFVAIIANVIFYFIVTRWLNEPLLMLDEFPRLASKGMGVDEVILFSVIFSLGAGLVYAGLSVLMARPERTFLVVSIAVLLVSLALPFKAPTPPVAMSAKLSLVMMHIIGAAVVIPLLVGLGRKRA